MKLARYFPGFMDDDDFEDYLTEVNTMEEVFALPWVKSWADDPNFVEFVVKDFCLYAVMTGPFKFHGLHHHYLIAYSYEDQPYLIQEPGVINPSLTQLPQR